MFYPYHLIVKFDRVPHPTFPQSPTLFLTFCHVGTFMWKGHVKKLDKIKNNLIYVEIVHVLRYSAFNLLSNLLKPLTFKGHYSCTQPFEAIHLILWNTKRTILLLDPCVREYSISIRYIPYGKGPFHIPYNSSIWFLRLMWAGCLGILCKPQGGLCNNNSFINKYDVMIRSSDFFLMSFFNLLTKELWQILECKFWGVNYPNYPFFSEFFSKFSISQNKMPVSISSTYVIYTYLPHTSKKIQFGTGLAWKFTKVSSTY